jgi:choline-sulfatase
MRDGKPSTRGWRPARRALLAAFVAGLVATAASVPSGQTRKPSLLLITLDTVRADHLGCYGDKAAATPVLDRLAREGVRFADATTHAPITGPSHAGILTGVYPARYGIRDNASTPLPSDALTLAEALKTVGYRTGAFIGAFILDRAYGFDQGFDTFDATFDRFAPGDKLQVERPASAVVKPALAWLDAVPADQPFFAWVHLYDAHTPYTPPPPFDVKFRSHPYDGEIAAVDQAIGRLLAALERRGRLDDTLIVAIGDHGESLGEHGEEDHGVFLYDAVLHIPWIMRLPSRERAGAVVREQVRAIDLMPTVLERLGVKPPAGLDGESLLPVVRGHGRASIPPAYAETYYPTLHFGWSALQSIRTGEWKLIEAPRLELYDLRSDATEKTSVASSETSRVARLRSDLKAIEAGWRNTPHAQTKTPDRETIQRLRSLGYVGVAAPSSGTQGPDPKDMIARLREYRLLMTGTTASLRKGRPQEAVEQLKRALTINPRAYDASLALGDVYMEMGQYDRAVGQYQAAARLNPASVDPLLAGATVLIRSGRLDEAGLLIEQAARLEPRSYDVAFAQGRLSEQRGQDAEAFEHYERAVAANPADARSHAYLATAALRLKKLDVAAAEFTRAGQLGYQPAQAQVGLGRVAELRGDRTAAIAAYRKALALDPGLAAARDGLARLGVRE